MMGASGYGGVFGRFAEFLADEFTVVTYDRRGNGQSPRPAGWTATSPEEQADDAAALLAGLGLAPAAIFGTSSAGIFALAALIRQPDSVRGAVLHEPGLFALFDDPEDVRNSLTQLVKEGMEAGGPARALECFLRFGAGDANWERLEPGVQKAMLASADTYFGVESGAFDSYLPDEETLASITIPIELLVSAQSHAFFSEAAARLAERARRRSRTDARNALSLSRPSPGARADGQAVPSGYRCVNSSTRAGTKARATFGQDRRLPIVTRDERNGRAAAPSGSSWRVLRTPACCCSPAGSSCRFARAATHWSRAFVRRCPGVASVR